MSKLPKLIFIGPYFEFWPLFGVWPTCTKPLRWRQVLWIWLFLSLKI